MARVHRISRQQEARGAERFGGRVTPGSGNGWVTKNDVITPSLSIEYKYTDKKSYSLKFEELESAEKNAIISDRDMVFIVRGPNGREWAITSREYFEEHQ